MDRRGAKIRPRFPAIRRAAGGRAAHHARGIGRASSVDLVDDNGDVSWVVPAGLLNFPASVPGIEYHEWHAAVTPVSTISHKGQVAGAKVLAASIIDLLAAPDLLEKERRRVPGRVEEDAVFLAAAGRGPAAGRPQSRRDGEVSARDAQVLPGQVAALRVRGGTSVGRNSEAYCATPCPRNCVQWGCTRIRPAGAGKGEPACLSRRNTLRYCALRSAAAARQSHVLART